MAITTIPYIPRTITVHLGLPDQWAENVTVSFPDYVKNVASSEIYPTWEPAAIRANVIAIVTYALNRVYTEFYPSRGYDFDITATTAYDQKFIKGRDIFENVSQVVDDLFNDYLRRVGTVEPLAAKFCNGTTTLCDGLSQWGSQSLAQEGLSAMEILRRYYGNDIELVTDAPVQDEGNSYPGAPLRLGDIGEPVFVIQASLNRISRNYPAIPKIWPVNGIFDEKTEESVKVFQSVFDLNPDGVVGEATWYKLVAIYVGVTRLGELVSEGQRIDRVGYQYPGILWQGSAGEGVRVLQYMLAVLAEFHAVLRPLRVDGIFGLATRQAVEEYQRYVGLTPDGIVGEQTWNRLYRSYIGLGSFLQRDRVRFDSEAAPAAGSWTAHGKQPRVGQAPGHDLSFGDSDGAREVLV